jgi:hypothetical protein
MSGLGKKPAAMASAGFARMFDQLSKAALIDVLWCACQLGTDESSDEITTQAARNAIAAMAVRKDRIPKDIAAQARLRIDSDGFPEDEATA